MLLERVSKHDKAGPVQDKTSSFLVNTTALFVLQFINYFLPFILIPYLTRILGPNLYGIVAFGLAIVSIANIVTDFGFNLSATYTIAKHRDDKNFISRVISAVFFCKSLLLLVVLMILGIFIVLDQKYAQYSAFFWLLYLIVIGQTFQPFWFFQGIEKMVYITIYSFIAKIFNVICVFWLVKEPSQYYFVAIANGCSQILAALVGVIMIFGIGYRLKWPGLDFIKTTFSESVNFFWSRAAVATYTSCGALFLGIFSSSIQVAYYSSAEQLYRGAQAIMAPVSQALYPHMARYKNYKLFFRIIAFATGISVIGCLIGVLSGRWFIQIIFGNGFENSYIILVVFLFIFIITTPSILLGYPFLGAMGKSNLVNRSVIIAGVLQLFLLLIFYLLEWTTSIYMVFTVLIVETTVLIFRIIWAIKARKNLINEESN